MSTNDVVARKKAANARIERALNSWPDAEETGELTPAQVEQILARGSSSRRRASGPASADLVAAVFPDAAAPVTRIRRRALDAAGAPAPATDDNTARSPSSPPPSSSRTAAPASGRVSYPPPPASGRHDANRLSDFGSQPSYPSYPPPVQSGAIPIDRPQLRAPSPLPSPPVQPAVVTAPLSMPTLPPIPSVPAAPISVRATGGSLPPAVASSAPAPANSPWLVLFGALAGAALVAGGWAATHRAGTVESSEVVVARSASPTAVAAAPAKAASPRAVDLSALPIAQAAQPRSAAPRAVAASAPRAQPSRATTDESSARVAAEEPVAPPPAPPVEAPVAAAEPEPAPPPAEAPQRPPTLEEAIKQSAKATTAAAAAKTEKTSESDDPAPAGLAPAVAPSTVRPSVGATQAALRKVLPAARACLKAGDAATYGTVTFESSGAVRSVAISGSAAGSPAEPCVHDALMGARVQPFAESTFAAPVTVRPL